MKTQVAVAALAVLLAIGSASATCLYTTCPAGYDSYTYAGLNCPVCTWPLTLQCGSYLSKPFCCGGTTGLICPAIACTTSTSYAIAGSTGCAKAKSTIQAVAISNSTFVTKSDVDQNVLATYCSPENPEEDWETRLVATATAAANAYAESVAKVFADFNLYVCDCGGCRQKYLGCNTAYTSVTAQIQAVATAQAYAVSEALARVQETCFQNQPQLLSLARGYAESFASSTELAIRRVHADAMTSSTSAGCRTITRSRTASAIAKAVACTYVQILAAARDACTPDKTYSCSTSLALAGSAAIESGATGSNWDCVCPLSVECKSPPPSPAVVESPPVVEAPPVSRKLMQ